MKNAPHWATDRAGLWNGVKAFETRPNPVTARKWGLALPSEISAEDRSQITRDFAQELVSRSGVAVDVAIHAPHRAGDQRKHHAHVLTSTRKLEAQREAALERGDQLSAEELDRDPELKLGPAANAIERREKAQAAREGREYLPVTERGVVVHALRQARAAFRKFRERLDIARETHGAERDAGEGRVSAGLAALRAAAAKGRGARAGPEDMRERLARVVDRSEDTHDTLKPEGRNCSRERLKETIEKDAIHRLAGHCGPELGNETVHDKNKSPANERLKDVWNRPIEKLTIEDMRIQQAETEPEIDREKDRDLGLIH